MTTSIWRLHGDYEMSERVLALSDVTSIHHYGETGIEAVIRRCQAYGRPVLCTEWLRRVVGQTVALILPIFARERIGWYNWGLVAGRTQTYLDWRRELNTPDSVTWQHDIFRDDGEPYAEEELRLIRSYSFSGNL